MKINKMRIDNELKHLIPFKEYIKRNVELAKDNKDYQERIKAKALRDMKTTANENYAKLLEKKQNNMEHIQDFESFLNEAFGVAKFQGKEIYPEGYDQSDFGDPIKSPNEFIAGQEYIFYDDEWSDAWVACIFWQGKSGGTHEFAGTDKHGDYQYWSATDKELMDLIKKGWFYKQK
jgi:hypothetical protein